MGLLKKVAEVINRRLSPKNKQKISDLTCKAKSVGKQIDDKLPADLKSKAGEFTQKAKVKSIELGKQAEEKVYKKYVPKDIRDTISSTIKEIKLEAHEAAEVFKEDMYQGKAANDHKSTDAADDDNKRS